MNDSKSVIVVGASPKPSRFSNRAVASLLEHGHKVIPLHPQAERIHGLDVRTSLEGIKESVDTVSLYVTKALSDGMMEHLIALSPRRVIFNPGTENPALRSKLEANGILALEACTLVLLASGEF